MAESRFFRYIEAPAVYEPTPGDPPVIFLAGGIPNVMPWHDDAAMLLDVSGTSMVVLCPRRRTFPVGDRAAGRAQVAWEHRHLHLAKVRLFWFAAPDPGAPVPAESVVQPTTLLELGMALGEGCPIAVGADPSYPRLDIVENQLALYPHIPLRDRLSATVQDAIELLGGESRG